MRILVRQILPHIMAPIAVQLTLDFARAISVEASLSYLGLGLSVPYISWGTMIRDNSEVRQNTTFGALALTLRPTGYDWRFVPEPGATFSDTGSGACH